MDIWKLNPEQLHSHWLLMWLSVG